MASYSVHVLEEEAPRELPAWEGGCGAELHTPPSSASAPWQELGEPWCQPDLGPDVVWSPHPSALQGAWGKEPSLRAPQPGPGKGGPWGGAVGMCVGMCGTSRHLSLFPFVLSATLSPSVVLGGGGEQEAEVL